VEELRKIYLAGPDVFLPNAMETGHRKQALCRKFGFEGLFPLDKEAEISADSRKIFAANCALMRQADIGLFNLSPFRGPSADVGTVFEIGFMFAMGKLLLGYTSEPAPLMDRVRRSSDVREDEDGRLWGSDGFNIENFGLTDNLMIDEAILKSGGSITRVEEEGPGALAALRAFETCLAAIDTSDP